MRWIRAHMVAIAGLLVLSYMLLPNIVVIVFSFNKPKGNYNYEWQRFSLDAWTNPCGTPGICDSLGLSLRHRFRGRSSTNLLIFLPMATPEVVMGSSLLTLFIAMGIAPGTVTILIAHILFCLSFVVVTVKSRIASLDPRLEQAAADLFANPFQAFIRVTLPLVAPGIAAGALLAFSLSFDDYIITNFNASPSSVTFPMFVWGASQRGTPVQINVIGTVMFLAALLLVATGQLISNRRAKSAA
jgi:spermidine/putrescine transport system permease protein